MLAVVKWVVVVLAVESVLLVVDELSELDERVELEDVEPKAVEDVEL